MNNARLENFIDPDELLSEQEKIKEQFSRPFTRHDVADQLKPVKEHESDIRAHNFNLLHRNIGRNTYLINYSSFYDFRTIEFQLMDESNKKVAELIFEENRDRIGTWKLMHRVVNTKEIGISGTEYLEKAEEYLKLARESGKIVAEEFTADASQEKVVNWLLKNGYSFATQEDQMLYQEFLDNPGDYELFKVKDGSGYEDFDRNAVIFKRSEIDREELENFINPDEPGLLDGDMSLLKAKGLLRIHLKKDLDPEVA